MPHPQAPESVQETARRLFEHKGLSVREIAAKLGVSKSAVDRWSRKGEWIKPQAEPPVPTVPAAILEASESPEEAIAMALRASVAVVTNHRRDIAAARDLCNVLMQQLRDTSVYAHSIEELLRSTSEGSALGAALQAVSLPERAQVILRLTGAMKNLIELERQAFGLDGDALKKRPPEAPPVRFQAFLGGKEQARQHGVTLDG